MILVSIVTPVYNASKYLSSVYQSLRGQSHTEWEWLVVDDCSIDGSFEILTSLAQMDSRIKVFKNERNSGPSVSRNVGIDNSKGDYIAFLDADDSWFPDKLEHHLKFMSESNSELSCHDYEIMDEAGGYLKDVAVPAIVRNSDLEAYNPIAASFTMVKKSAIGKLRFDPSLRRRQDWAFWFKITANGIECRSLKEKLGRYRKDSVHSISKNKFHMALIQWGMYRNYFKLGFFKSIISFVRYGLYGVMKHYLK